MTTAVPVSGTQPTPVAGGDDGISATSALLDAGAGLAAEGTRLARGVLGGTASVLESGAGPLLLLFGGGVALALALTRGRRGR